MLMIQTVLFRIRFRLVWISNVQVAWLNAEIQTALHLDFGVVRISSTFHCTKIQIIVNLYKNPINGPSKG